MAYVKSAMFFLGLSLLVFGADANVYSYIDPCHINDNDCILTSAKKALPYIIAGDKEKGIPGYDPMVLKKKVLDASNGPLELFLKDIEITGLGQLNFLEVKRPDVLNVVIDLECPITVKGKYTMKGNMIGIPVQGEDFCEIKIEKLKIIVKILLKKIKGNDNEDHYKIDKCDYEYEPLSAVKLHFNNMYDGDKQKAEPVEKIMNDEESAKGLFKTMGKPVINEIINEIASGLNKWLQAVPAKEIELV